MTEENVRDGSEVRGHSPNEIALSAQRRPIRIIVAGTRKWNDAVLFDTCMKSMLKSFSPDEVEFVSGDASSGADRLIKNWAKINGYPCRLFPADWDDHGKLAGFIRNVEMANYATHLIAYWDGASAGTKHMISEAKKRKFKVKVFRVELPEVT
jgi:hypothetical protein